MNLIPSVTYLQISLNFIGKGLTVKLKRGWRLTWDVMLITFSSCVQSDSESHSYQVVYFQKEWNLSWTTPIYLYMGPTWRPRHVLQTAAAWDPDFGVFWHGGNPQTLYPGRIYWRYLKKQSLSFHVKVHLITLHFLFKMVMFASRIQVHIHKLDR